MIKKLANPNIEEFEVIYISEGDKLENLEPKYLNLIDSASKECFLNKESKIDELISSINSPYAREWYGQLLSKKCGLAILEKGKGNYFESPGGCYLVFQTDNESFESDEWGHLGCALDFQKKLYNPNHYYPELLDILKFSSVHFNEWYGLPKFTRLGDDNLAINNQWINPLLQELEIDELDIGSLRFLYEDGSGNHLFYDHNLTIWYGGIDDADFCKSKLSARDLLESVFSAHLKEKYPEISSIANGKYI